MKFFLSTRSPLQLGLHAALAIVWATPCLSAQTELAASQSNQVQEATETTATLQTDADQTDGAEQGKTESEKATDRKNAANDQSLGMPLVFEENFEQDASRWETTDDTAWSRHESGEGNHVFGLTRRQSNYEPKVRSPYNIALIKDIELEDFVLIYRVRSTKDTGNHRDCCTFFCHQNAQQFYYVHLGAKPDPASGQIMIVNEEPRRPLTDNKKLVPWDDEWHTVKLVRDGQAGTIKVYFDDMETPHMEATDKTFGRGRLGIGSFDDMNDFDDIRLYGR